MISKGNFPIKLVFHLHWKGNRLKLHTFFEVICFLYALCHVLEISGKVIILSNALIILAVQNITRFNNIIWNLCSKKEGTLARVDLWTVKLLVILYNLEGKRKLYAKQLIRRDHCVFNAVDKIIEVCFVIIVFS
jgi:hypothetical protein